MSIKGKITCPICGETRVTRSNDKRDRRCKACYTESQKISPNQDSTYKSLIHSMRGGAKRRGISYELSFEEFKEIVSMNCHWCGIEPTLKKPKKERMPTLSAPAHGIDRVDNSLGYVYNNCVASCQMCNIAKNNKSKEEFLLWIKRVYANQFKENNA